jgi:hypothetical protein
MRLSFFFITFCPIYCARNIPALQSRILSLWGLKCVFFIGHLLSIFKKAEKLVSVLFFFCNQLIKLSLSDFENDGLFVGHVDRLSDVLHPLPVEIDTPLPDQTFGLSP